MENRSLEIVNVLLDELNISKVTYSIIQDNVAASLFIRNFHEFNSNYLNIAYEINTYTAIARINSKHLHTIRKHFCVLPEQEVIDFCSHVAVLEPITTNLSGIIKHRRKEAKMWTFHEFHKLFSELVEGVHALHSNGLTHNDIRPSNVYYSAEKDCYLLGSFSNVMRST